MNDLDFLGFVESTSTLDPVSYQYFQNLLKNRTIILNSAIDENILENVVIPLLQFEKDNDASPVTLFLNTVGGSVSDGLMLCNVIDNYKKKLDIIVPSYACSMGTIILCAGNNNKNVTKKAYPFSFGLLHSGQTYIEGESTSAEDVMNFNKKIDERIRQYIINHTSITPEEYDVHHREQWYLTAEEMKNYGLIDEIIGQESDVND